MTDLNPTPQAPNRGRSRTDQPSPAIDAGGAERSFIAGEALSVLEPGGLTPEPVGVKHDDRDAAGEAQLARSAESRAEALHKVTSDATRAAGRAADHTLESSRRVSEEGVDLARRAASTSIEAARRHADASLDIHRDAADAGRQIAQTRQQTLDQASELWRSSLQPFVSLQLEMNRMLEDAWRQMTGFSVGSALRPATPTAAGGFAALLGQPPADLKDIGKGYSLNIEAPGLEAADISVSLSGDALVISGHKSEAKEQDAGAYRVSERRFGRFERVFPMPHDVDRDRIEASLKNGVLNVILPRTHEAAQEARKIEVRA